MVSVGMHGAGLALVLLAPTPRGPRWHPPDAIAVALVAAPSRAARETPAPPAPEIAAPEPEPEPEAPKPEVVQAKPPPKPAVKPPVPRTIRRNAPRRPDEPSLEERIRQRLAEVESEAAPPEDASTPAAAASPAAGGGSRADVQAVDFPYAWYLNVLRTRITDAWDPPGESLLANRARQVVVAFRVFRDGRVTDVEVSGASGTPGLDASARRAVQRAQPFPPLPEAYPGESLEVAVRFTVEDAS